MIVLIVSAWVYADDTVYYNSTTNTIVAENTMDYKGRSVHTKVIKYLNCGGEEYSIWLDIKGTDGEKPYSCVSNTGHLKDPRIKPWTIKRLKKIIANFKLPNKNS